MYITCVDLISFRSRMLRHCHLGAKRLLVLHSHVQGLISHFQGRKNTRLSFRILAQTCFFVSSNLFGAMHARHLLLPSAIGVLVLATTERPGQMMMMMRLSECGMSAMHVPNARVHSAAVALGGAPSGVDAKLKEREGLHCPQEGFARLCLIILLKCK